MKQHKRQPKKSDTHGAKKEKKDVTAALLEALQAIAAPIPDDADAPTADAAIIMQRAEFERRVDLARAAIAKATGGEK